MSSSLSKISAQGYAVYSASGLFKLFKFQRRCPKADDIVIRIHFCAICHTDIHQVDNDWEHSNYPLVPGHEITGIVQQVGEDVKQFHVGDRVGVGSIVDSCLQCEDCLNNKEQFCCNACYTCNGTELDKVTPTYGGYSNIIVVKEHFVCKIPDNLPLDAAAPLLCAGITTYSPLKQYNVGANTRMGVVGLGGLGHMAVKFGVALGAHVTVISSTESKRNDASKLGAKGFLFSKDAQQLKSAQESLDFILDTVSTSHDVPSIIDLLSSQGVYCIVGASPKPIAILPLYVISKRPTITGSLLGGMKETREMLDFCSQHEITCDIEKIEPTPENIYKAYDRMAKSDAKYRFVLDIFNSLK